MTSGRLIPIALLALTFPFFGHAADKNPGATPSATAPVTVKAACSPDETWAPKENVKIAYIQSHLTLSKEGFPGTTQSLLRALVAKDQLKPNDLRGNLVISYWLARVLYDNKEIHLAQQAFQDILKQPAEIDKFAEGTAIRSAAMQCLTRIHHDSPTLTLDSEALASVRLELAGGKLSAEQRGFFQEGVGWDLKSHFIAKADSTPGSKPAGLTDADLQQYAKDFADNGYYQKLLAVLRASRNADEAGVVANESIFKEKYFASRPRNERDLLNMVFARAYYDQGDWKQSIAHFSRISNDSNWVVNAFSGSSWASLSQGQYLEAINKSTNIVLGGLAKTFEPGAYETLSIALYETCNYTEAVQTFQQFRKVYGKSYFFLKSTQDSPNGLYGKLTAYLLGKKTTDKAPARVVAEWSSDPVFLANQSEINVALDEEEATAKIRKSANQWTKFAKTPSWKNFDARLAQRSTENVALQSHLIAEIDFALREKSRIMFDALNQTTQNLQLLEAETYETIGNKYLAENSPVQAKPTKRAIASNAGERPTWNWGRYPTSESDDESAETWNDELGYLRVKVKDSCR